MTSRWRQERRRDHFYRAAKEKGYRSRASFKLRQAVEKYHFIRKGDRVIDLGASPGGWMQVARQIVGSDGYVLGVDIEDIRPFEWDNVDRLRGDILDGTIFEHIEEKVSSPVDVIISDVSPDITGAWDVDHARQIQLAERSLEIAQRFLRRGGNFFVKAFHGPELTNLKQQIGTSFERVRYVKPAASRRRSSEIYILAQGYKG